MAITNHQSLLIPASATFVAVAGAWGILLVRRADKKRLVFNETDWKVVGLPWPSYWVRWINHALPGYATVMLPVLKHFVIQPAVRKSLATMERADQDPKNTIPKILCDAKARQDFQERLNVYYRDIHRSPTLTQFGKIFNYIGALSCLQNHVGLLKLAMDNPQVRDEKVDKPVFIVSFSRTGTTILHRTMALDREQWRNFDVCDMLCPLPQPAARWDFSSKSKKSRLAKAQQAQALFDSVNMVYPGWFECLQTMHAVRPNEADEDMMWYNSAIGHPYMDPLMRLYQQARLGEQQPGGTLANLESKKVAKYKYAWLKLVMQLHQHVEKTTWPKDDDNNNTPCPDRPWLLKDPNHSARLPELLEVFPDARLIFTHRPPAEIVPSLAKLMAIFVSVDFLPGSPGSTSAELGAETVKRMQHYANGIVDFTRQQEDGTVLAFCKAPQDATISDSSSPYASNRRIDFWFRDVVTNIPGTIAKVYAHFLGVKPSDKAQEAFAEYLKANARAKLGNQPRCLEDFGLTQEDMEKAFRDYNELFLTKYP